MRSWGKVSTEYVVFDGEGYDDSPMQPRAGRMVPYVYKLGQLRNFTVLAPAIIPSLVYDDEGDIPRGETASARAPHGADDLLRVFSDPRDGSPSQEFSLEGAFQFL